MPTCHLVDVFASEPGQGNPAGVVYCDTPLDAVEMQRIAAVVGCSETACVTQQDGRWRIRWFTPTCEVKLCGHATLAAAHVLFETEREQVESGVPLELESLSGKLTVLPEPLGGDLILWFCRPAPTMLPFVGELAPLLRALGSPAQDPELQVAVTSGAELLLPLVSPRAVTSVQPDFAALGQVCRDHGWCGVSVFAVPGGGQYELSSRFFAPVLGVDEDPVTGSVHGSLLTYLFLTGLYEHDPEELRGLAWQGIPGGRGGMLWLRLRINGEQAATAEVGGQAVTSGTREV